MRASVQTKAKYTEHHTPPLGSADYVRLITYIHEGPGSQWLSNQWHSYSRQASATRGQWCTQRDGATYKQAAAWFRRLLTNSPLWFTRLWTIDLYGSQKQLVNPVNHMVRSAGPSTTFHRTGIRSKSYLLKNSSDQMLRLCDVLTFLNFWKLTYCKFKCCMHFLHFFCAWQLHAIMNFKYVVIDNEF